MAIFSRILFGVLMASSCFAHLDLIPRNIFQNSAKTRKAFQELKPSDEPFLIGPGPSLEDGDVEELKKHGCQYLGSFTVTAKFGSQKPPGELLDHHVMNIPRGADKDAITVYLIRRKLNWIFDLCIPRTDGNVIKITYGPQHVEGLPEDDGVSEVKGLPKDEDKVRWIKAEDRIVTNCDQQGPTAAFYQDLKSPDADMRVITSNYPEPDFLNQHVDQVMDKIRGLKRKGWNLLGTSRERIMFVSARPNNTWWSKISGWADYALGRSESTWERTAREVFLEVEQFVPYYGPNRVPFDKVAYYNLEGKLVA